MLLQGIRCLVGSHELLSKQLTSASAKSTLKALRAKKRSSTHPSGTPISSSSSTKPSVFDVRDSFYDILQYLASISAQANLPAILVLSNSPSDQKIIRIDGCRTRDCCDPFGPFYFTSLHESGLIEFISQKVEPQHQPLYRRFRSSSFEEVTQSARRHESPNDMVTEDSYTRSSSSGKQGSELKDSVIYVDKMVSNNSGKSKFKEHRLLSDKIKSQFLDTFCKSGSAYYSIPQIIAVELPLLELRDLGSFLMRNLHVNLFTDSSLLRIFQDEVEVYASQRTTNRKSIKNLIAEVFRMLNTNYRQLFYVTYSLSEELFDTFQLRSFNSEHKHPSSKTNR